MNKPLNSDSDLYFLSEAAELISDQVGHDHVQREQLAKDMREAVGNGELGAYFYTDGEALQQNAIGKLVRTQGDDKHCTVEPTTPLCVRPTGVNAWLKTTSWGFTWDIPASAPAKKTSTAELRQTKRWNACIVAGLQMPTDTYRPYPRGINDVAKKLGITRQSLTEDLSIYRERIFGGKNGR